MYKTVFIFYWTLSLDLTPDLSLWTPLTDFSPLTLGILISQANTRACTSDVADLVVVYVQMCGSSS